MNQQTEKLLARLLIVLSQKFKDHLVLKGGMQLRLLSSPRSTQDIDFVLLSSESKKKLVIIIREVLLKMDDIQIIREDLNSRGIFIEVKQKGDDVMALMEINVKKKLNMKPEPVSSGALTNQYLLGNILVSVMALPEAFSNKIAATIERKTMRDLYDLSFYESMCSFDLKTLEDRLLKASVGRAKPKSVGLDEAAFELKKRVNDMTEDDLKKELYPLLPKEMRKGQLRIIQAAVNRIAQKLESMKE